MFPKGEALTVDVDAVIEACRKEQIRLLVFFQPPATRPHWGCGGRRVRRLIRSVDALVVLDEAYMDFWDQTLLPEALGL